MWRYGGEDWTSPWRMYHGLGADFVPLNDPAAPARPIAHLDRYRNLIYGFGLAVDVLERGVKDVPYGSSRPPRREHKRPSGLILPTPGAPARG